MLPTPQFADEFSHVRAAKLPHAPYGERAYLLQPSHYGLAAWEIRHHSLPSEFANFISNVEMAIKSNTELQTGQAMKFIWKSTKTKKKPVFNFGKGRETAEVSLNTKSPDYSEVDLQAAKLLSSTEIRGFALRFAQVGKVRGIDIISDADDSITQPLLGVGILKKEYLVLCKKDSHTICTVENRDELDDTKGGRFLCSICGRAFKDEIVQEILAFTSFGKKLLNKSHWMTIWITDLLVQSGIIREQISWNATANEDELDIMVETPDTRIFFELKDREFGLGDAYPFATRVTRYRGDVGVVITTECVADEAKKFFAEQSSGMTAKIDLIEGPQSTNNNIQMLIDRVSRNSIHQLVSEFGLLMGFNLEPIITLWMNSSMRGVTGLIASSGDLPDEVITQ